MSISSTASQGRAMIFRLISSTATKTATKGHTFAGVRYRLFHNSDQTLAGKIWRQSVGLPKLQTSTISIFVCWYELCRYCEQINIVGTHTQTHFVLDGRPVPLSVGQMKRLQVQEQLAVMLYEMVQSTFCFYF